MRLARVSMTVPVLAAALLLLAAGHVVPLAAPALAQQVKTQTQQVQPEPQCQTIGGTTYCKDGTQFDQTQAGQPNAAAAADGKPAVQSLGRTGPTQYQVDNTRIFGVDDRIRRLGETHVKTGQQDAPRDYSGRNCFQFNTSYFCD